MASSGTPSEGRREAGWTEGMDSAGEGDNERPKAEEVGRDEAEEEWDALVGGGWSDDEGGEDQDSDDEEGQDNDGYTQVFFCCCQHGGKRWFCFSKRVVRRNMYDCWVA